MLLDKWPQPVALNSTGTPAESIGAFGEGHRRRASPDERLGCRTAGKYRLPSRRCVRGYNATHRVGISRFIWDKLKSSVTMLSMFIIMRTTTCFAPARYSHNVVMPLPHFLPMHRSLTNRRRTEVLTAWGMGRVAGAAFATGIIFIAGGNAALASSKKTNATATSGMASYYGYGGRTANGERHSAQAMTAAHRSLPFNTRVRVTNKSNGRSVVVRINDRGPFVKGRIIDVSTAVADELGFRKRGVAKVDIAVVD
jgi:rare lipoprotein A